MLAHTLLFTLPGVPLLLYGEEHGLSCGSTERALADVWLERRPMPWTGAWRDPEVRRGLRTLLHARRDSEALREGSMQVLFVDNTTLRFRRQSDGDIVDVVINFADVSKHVEIGDAEYPRLTPIASLSGAVMKGESIDMPPLSAMLVRRERAAGRSIMPSRARQNLVLRDRDLVLAAPHATARPSRLKLAITAAARTMTPEVVGALAIDFGFADYFAVGHGGETLSASILFDMLRAIAKARGPEPYVAHLLTNGVLLDVAMAEKLVGLGVSSIAVSLDGAKAKNDATRFGGRFFDVRENLRRVIRWRICEGIDLRVGITTAVLSQNLGELEAIVDLGADLSVDWMSFEAGSLVAIDGRAAIERATLHGRERGLAMIDRTATPPIWRCRLDDATRARLEDEELAARAPVHPCRAPWEIACVEPNGDVRVADFTSPILGNVLETPLQALWNAEAAAERRRAASLTRLCGPNGPVVCVDPDM
jgi:MoaA/NifB/PqqE/SkfB family radical SAM enzyme